MRGCTRVEQAPDNVAAVLKWLFGNVKTAGSE